MLTSNTFVTLPRLGALGVTALLMASPPISSIQAEEVDTVDDEEALPEIDETDRSGPEFDEIEAEESVGEQESGFPWLGEELYYSVRVNDSEALRAGVRIGEVENRGGRAYIPISAMAQSQGFFDAIYPVDDRINLYLDPVTTRPLRSEMRLDENDRFRTYDVDYHLDDYLAKVERYRNRNESSFQEDIPGNTHNMMSWLYQLRQTDDISLGDEFSYYIYDGWLLSRLDLEVVERQDLLTPMGWFKTWELEFERQIMRSRSTNDDGADPSPPDVNVRDEARHTGSVWLSRDENLLPVRFTVDSTFGSGEVVIIRYVPGEAQ